MEQHPHTIWGWINHHWGVISFVYFPTFMFYLRIFVDSCKVAGWTLLANIFGKLELFLTTFVNEVKAQKQAQTPPKTGA